MSYITLDDVETRLLGKVRFSDADDDENRFPRKLLKRLIREAEGQVERDLSPRYAAPFRGENDEAFTALPSTTRETLRTAVELMAVIRVLGNDFGRGTVTDGGAFKKEQSRLYKGIVDRELRKREGHDDSAAAWAYPPLDGLRTHDVNAQDDGGHGAILVTGRGDGDYPAKQITDPSESFFNGEIDE